MPRYDLRIYPLVLLSIEGVIADDPVSAARQGLADNNLQQRIRSGEGCEYCQEISKITIEAREEGEDEPSDYSNMDGMPSPFARGPHAEKVRQVFSRAVGQTPEQIATALNAQSGATKIYKSRPTCSIPFFTARDGQAVMIVRHLSPEESQHSIECGPMAEVEFPDRTRADVFCDEILDRPEPAAETVCEVATGAATRDVATLRELIAMLLQIPAARDYTAEIGKPSRLCAGRDFDDWAADLADNVVKGLEQIARRFTTEDAEERREEKRN